MVKRDVYNCLMCGTSFSIQRPGLKNRKIRSGEPICGKCYRETSKWLKNIEYYPKGMQEFVKADILDYKKIEPFLDRIK